MKKFKTYYSCNLRAKSLAHIFIQYHLSINEKIPKNKRVECYFDYTPPPSRITPTSTITTWATSCGELFTSQV